MSPNNSSTSCIKPGYKPSSRRLSRASQAGEHACFRGGGRLVLLKAVLAAIPIYFMSIFKMPVGVHRHLEQSMRDFFWRDPLNEKSGGMASVPWETLSRPVDQGGLSVRQLIQTNTALLSKWVSRILHPTGELVTSVLRDEYRHTLDW